MRPAPLAIALLAVSACSQSPAPPAAREPQSAAPTGPASEAAAIDPDVLTPEGLGDIAVGKAPPAGLKADGTQVSDGCRTYTDQARRIYAMTDGKVVARITAMSGSPVKTAQGIAVGASEAAVRKAYPDLAEEPHKYVDAPAKYLDWRPGEGTSGLRFEIDGQGKVGAIHAGREPEIAYVEGCA